MNICTGKNQDRSLGVTHQITQLITFNRDESNGGSGLSGQGKFVPKPAVDVFDWKINLRKSS